MTNKLLAYGVAILAGFVIALALFGSHVKERERAYERVVVRDRVDTVREIVRVPIAPVHVSGRSTRRTFMNNKRCAELDTLVRQDTSSLFADTLHIAYCMPEDRFNLRFGLSPRRAPVAIPIVLHDTLIEQRESLGRDASRPWYEEVLMILGAAAAGYLVGRIIP